MPAAWKLSHLGKTMESGKPESVKSVALRAYVNTQKPNTKAASLLFATSVFLLSQTIVLSNFPSPFLASYPRTNTPFALSFQGNIVLGSPRRPTPAQGSCLPHSTTSAVQNLSLAVKRNIFLGQRHPIEHLFYSIATLARFLVSSDLQSPHST